MQYTEKFAEISGFRGLSMKQAQLVLLSNGTWLSTSALKLRAKAGKLDYFIGSDGRWNIVDNEKLRTTRRAVSEITKRRHDKIKDLLDYD